MRSIFVSLVVLAAVGSTATATLAAQPPCVNAATKGCFELPFNHRNDLSVTNNVWTPAVWDTEMAQKFNALHMVLLGAPELRGKILAWDYGTPLCDRSSPGIQRWSILDPTKLPSTVGAFENFTLTGIPTDPPVGGQAQDPACAGFTVLPNGHVLVVGGTQKYGGAPPSCPPNEGAIVGARLVYTFRPENWGTAFPLWQYETNQILAAKRYYPTAVLGKDQDVYILRGHTDDSNPLGVDIPDTYERWVAATGALDPFGSRPGPDPSRNGSAYLVYPRAHLLSNEQLFLCGFFPEAAYIVDPASGWFPKGVSAHFNRVYGNSVLFPNIDARHTDAVMILGGQSVDVTIPPLPVEVLDTVQICKASAANPGAFAAPTQGYTWTPVPPAPGGYLPSMHNKRVYANAVLLPDASVLVVGGTRTAEGVTPPDYVFELERFRGGQWEVLASMTTLRRYHHTALLLPSGKVLIAGGEAPRLYDYEVYSPPYMWQPRPEWTQTPQENVTYGGTYPVHFTMPAGAALARVVLMRPGAVTHHFDGDQRYYQATLDIPMEGETSPRWYTLPNNPNALPPGYYMIWLVTTTGVPSEARWIKVQ